MKTKRIGRDKLIGQSDISEIFSIDGDGRDRILNFNPSCDALEIDRDLVDGLKILCFEIASNRRALKNLYRSYHQLIYFEPRGKLIYDENGANRGRGDGGMVVKLLGQPSIKFSDIIFSD